MFPLDETSRRLVDLERANKRLGWLVFLLALLVVGQTTFSCVGRGAARPTEPLRALSVKSLDVVNDNGEVVVHLGVRTSGAGGLWIAEANGARVLKLNQNDAGGLITVLDRAGESAGSVGVGDDGKISVGK